MSSSFSISENNDLISVITPYNPDFAQAARNMGGEWDRNQKVWVFRAKRKDFVIKSIEKHYGVDLSAPDTDVVCRVTAKRYIESDVESSLMVGPVPVARAFSRDSGAKICDGVCLLSGSVDSGGSRKNWVTTVEEDSVFELTLLRSVVELINDYDWDVEILPESKDKANKSSEDDEASLQARRSALKVELEEVEKKIKELNRLKEAGGNEERQVRTGSAEEETASLQELAP